MCESVAPKGDGSVRSSGRSRSRAPSRVANLSPASGQAISANDFLEVDADVRSRARAAAPCPPLILLPIAQPFGRQGLGHLPETLLVRSGLDEAPVVGRDRPGRAALDQAPRRLDREQIVVRPLLADAMARALQEGREIRRGGQQHDAARMLKAGRAVRPVVPVQPADTLQEHVDRGEIGDQQVGIDIERLLERLGGDDERRPRGRVLAEALLDRRIEKSRDPRQRTARGAGSSISPTRNRAG